MAALFRWGVGLVCIAVASAADTPAAPSTKASAGAPAEAATGAAQADFHKLFGQWKDLLTQLQQLRVDYQNADDTRGVEIKRQYNELIAKGTLMQSQLIDAAEKAYAEAPNQNQEVADLLFQTSAKWLDTDKYEEAYRIGKLLAANGYPEKGIYALVGQAAYVVGDPETAEKFLTKANAAGLLPERGQQILADLPQHKKRWAREQKLREAEAKANDLPRVLFKTSKGDIEIELFENEVPNSTANFVALVEKGFYNGLTFHRVLPQFMAQGGCPRGDGAGGPGYTIACECYQPNHREHFRGSLSMAHAGRDTGGSQFFLTFVPTSYLDGKHTVFGRVIGGMDVLAKLQRRNPQDTSAPLPTPDKILQAKVLRKRPHAYAPKKGPER